MDSFRGSDLSKVKKEFAIEHLINWYLGNYLDSPNNSIREDNFDPDKDDWKPIWGADIENLRKELKGRWMSHSNFLRFVKENGIHGKYYKYRKYVSECGICKTYGIKFY